MRSKEEIKKELLTIAMMLQDLKGSKRCFLGDKRTALINQLQTLYWVLDDDECINEYMYLIEEYIS